MGEREGKHGSADEARQSAPLEGALLEMEQYTTTRFLISQWGLAGNDRKLEP